MLAVLLVLAATAAWLRLLGWLYRHATTHRGSQVTNVYPVAPAQPWPLTADDAAARLDLSPTGYHEYVERGLADLGAFLDNQPAA
jgi:hypothetical protein